MTNSKQEMNDILKQRGYDWDEVQEFIIDIHKEDCKPMEFRGTTEGEFPNVDYDSSWGAQELFGHVLMKDGTWFERSEYDGSEYWSYKHRPEPILTKDK